MIIFCNLCKKNKEVDENLTKKEIEILQFIKNYRKKHRKSPTVREIGKEIKSRSVSGIDRYIYKLCEAQYIAKKPYKARSIVLLKDIPCG